MEGIVFNIQKFSLHDGPGIRTSVFMKGCPLRCAWCANPESQRMEPEALGEAEAATLAGAARSLSDVLSVCLQDLDFYQESGGGVTLSGGEPLMQPDFCAALLTALRGAGVHTAIETTACATSEVFERVCGCADLLLIDLKHWDDGLHRAGTGAGLEPVLGNLRHAVGRGWNVLPRIPVIPGYNDADSDARMFAARLKEVGAARAQLLPFHPFGERKYEQLGREYAYAGLPATRESALTGFLNALRGAGIDAFF